MNARHSSGVYQMDRAPAVGLGVLANALAAANDVVERNVYQGAVQVDVADLQAAQLTAADTVGRVGLEPTTGGL